MLHELADPLRVLHIRLATRNVAQVMRVQKPALKPILERLEHGLPVHARGLHPNERHARLGQPRSELREPAERRAERFGLLIPAATTRARNTHGRHDIVAMHIETRAPLHHHIHSPAPFETTVDSRPEGTFPLSRSSSPQARRPARSRDRTPAACCAPRADRSRCTKRESRRRTTRAPRASTRHARACATPTPPQGDPIRRRSGSPSAPVR